MAAICDECFQSFSRQYEASRHAKDIHGPRTRCPIHGCNWAVRREARVKDHLVKKHNWAEQKAKLYRWNLQGPRARRVSIRPGKSENRNTSTFVDADLHTPSSRWHQHSAPRVSTHPTCPQVQAPFGCGFSGFKPSETQISEGHGIKAEETQGVECIPSHAKSTPVSQAYPPQLASSQCWSPATIAPHTFVHESYNTEFVYAFNQASGTYGSPWDCVFSSWGDCIHGVAAETCSTCIWGWTAVP